MTPQTSGGVYAVVHTPTGDRYIGSTSNLIIRWRQHQWALRTHRHYSKRMQAAFNQDGIGVFRFDVLAFTDDEATQNMEERRLIAQLAPVYNANMLDGASGGVRMGEVPAPLATVPSSGKQRRGLVSLPLDLLREVDGAVSRLNRTAFIERAIRAALASQPPTE